MESFRSTILSIDTNDFICNNENCVKMDNTISIGKSNKKNISNGNRKK